jgi:hypothetical protein
MADYEFKEETLTVTGHVTYDYSLSSLTGPWADEKVGGWIWDRRLPEDFDINSTRYMTVLGGHVVGLRDGTYQELWQSGVVQGLCWHDLVGYRTGESLTWTPRFQTGRYAVYWEEHNLLSDYCQETRFGTGLENGVNSLVLPDSCQLSTLEIILFERDADQLRRIKYKPEYVETFTGILEDGSNTRLSTVDGSGNIIWANLCPRHHEYTVVNNKIYLNGDYSIHVGQTTLPLDSTTIPDLLEDVGVGNTAGRDAYTRYFPLSDDPVRVFVRHIDGTNTEWTEVDNLFFSGPADHHFCVDRDLGILTIGGYQPPALFLSEAIDEDTTTISCYSLHGDTDSYPPYGRLMVGSEEVFYYERGRSTFYDCVRGCNGTVASAHSKGETVTGFKQGAGTLDSDEIYVAYTAVPRVSYEIVADAVRSANGSWLDLRPTSHVQTRSVVQISASELNLASVVLECDCELIGDTLYGPLYYGTDSTRLTATGYDVQGNPVEGIELEIVLLSGPGSLNGIGTTYTYTTNSEGQISCLYNAPYDWSSIAKVVNTISYLGGDTIFSVSDLPPDLLNEEITTYQVLKHDKILGTRGMKIEITAIAQPAYLGDGTFVSPASMRTEAVFEDPVSKFEGGSVYFICNDGIAYSRGVQKVTQHWDNTGNLEYTTIYLDASVPSFGPIATVTDCWLYEKDADYFSSLTDDGVRVVLYEWSLGAWHPLTGEVGAYTPVRPDSSTASTLTYNNRLLPQGSMTDNDENLAGYLVVCPSISTFYAWGRDPMSGRVIVSNDLRIRLTLPAYLTGVDTSGALPIPYGFTFVTESFNVGTGLGGANFITINPRASGVNAFNLSVGIG